MKDRHAFYALMLVVAGLLPSSAAAQDAVVTSRPYPALITKFSTRGEPPVLLAIVQKGTEKLREELTKSPELNVRTESGLTPLMAALYTDAPTEKVRMLLQARANANFPDANGCTPLYYALRRNKPEVVRLLIEHGASVKQLTPEGHSALKVVTEFWMKELIDFILLNGGDFRETFRHGRLIHYAAAYQHRSLIEWLLKQGESIDQVFPADGTTPLIAAVRKGTDNAVRVVLEFEPQINAQDKAGWTALMHAVANDKLTMATRLMRERGANCKLAAKDGTTLYQIAGRRGFVDLQKELQEDGLAVEKITLPSALDKFVLLAPAKRLALTMAAYELYIACEEFDSLVGDDNELDRLHARALLTGNYRLRTVQDLKEKTHFYLTKGERAGADEAADAAKLSDDEFKEKLKTLLDDPVKLNALRKSRAMARSGGAAASLAWDLCHHNTLVILGVRAGWISDEDAWPQLLEAAELLKTQCPDWATVAGALRTKLVSSHSDPKRVEIILRLFENKMGTNSPWLLTPLAGKQP